MHDSLSTPPSPKSTFSDDQTTNPESADHFFVPDLQATLMNSNQGNIHAPIICPYTVAEGVSKLYQRPGASDLKPLESDSRLLTDEKFQKLKSKTTNQSLFRATKNSSKHNRLVRIIRRSLADEGMTHYNPDNEWPKANRIYISHWWIFSKSLRRQSKCNFKKFVV